MNASRTLGLFFAVAVILSASVASADGTAGSTSVEGSSPDVAAAAQALFIDGKRLVAQGRYQEACAKFEQSHRLDPAVGTQINLADCYEKIGRVASAWMAFHAAVVAAQHANHADWAEQARQRASLLEDRVPRLTLVVDDPPAGLRVSRGDTVMPESTFDSPVPVDSGVYDVAAAAPGRQPWATRVTVENAARVVLHIPVLTPTEPAAPTTEARATASAPEPPLPTAPIDRAKRNDAETLPHAAAGGGARSAAWLTAGAAAALAVGGVAALVVRGSNVAVYDDDARCLYGDLTRDQRCGTYRGMAATAEAFAIAQLGVAAAAAATSAFLFVLPFRAAAPRSASSGCRLGATLTCGGTF
jgi:tetratricopeptide (TPR) repeat protein